MSIAKTAKPIKIGISCLVFDSPRLERILLIKREKPPLENMWSFPGGRLDADEHIKDGMIRETYEETGYRINLIENLLFNIEHSINSEYLILTGMGIITDPKSAEAERTEDDKKIVSQFFDLQRKDNSNFLYDLKQEECVPSLHAIIERYLSVYPKHLFSK